MASKKVKICDTVYESVRDANEAVLAILYRYKNGEMVSVKDAPIIRYLLEHHPDKAQKIGKGIHHFFVARNMGGTRCFYVHRKDGSNIDFSYKKCLKNCHI